MKIFEIFKRQNFPTGELLTLKNVVEKGLLTREEMLMIQKIRATREWEKEAELSGNFPKERSHHRRDLDRSS